MFQKTLKMLDENKLFSLRKKLNENVNTLIKQKAFEDFYLNIAYVYLVWNSINIIT